MTPSGRTYTLPCRGGSDPRRRPGRRRRSHLGPALCHASRFFGARGAVATQRVDAVPQIDVVAAETAFRQDGGDLGRHAARALPARIHHHAGEARRERQAIEELAFRGDAARPVDGAEVGEQGAGFIERRRRRRVEKHELRRIGDAPLGKVQHQRRQIGGEDFRLRIGLKRRSLRFVP